MRFGKTKIVCTIGPASSKPATLRNMIKAGMDVARLNFSHGDHKSYLEVLKNVRKYSQNLKIPVAILQDLSGAKVRLGKIRDNVCVLVEGKTVVLTTKNVIGTAEKISISYKNLPREIKRGESILINDGAIKLRVVGIDKDEILCKVVLGGEVSSNKGVNLPKTKLNVGALTEKDKRDIKFGLRHNVDFFALSFVRKGSDIAELRDVIRKAGKDIPIIAKIEKREALRNLEEIVREADGVMVARGDLGVEIDLEDIPSAQKEIIGLCNRLGKPVITATQMLESMVNNRKPTRAEVTDVANAIYDGTDAIMLSQETAIGKYPEESIRMMASIALRTEKDFEPTQVEKIKAGLRENEIPDAICRAVSSLARDLKLKAIVACTTSGYTARLIARYRPKVPIFAVSPLETTIKRLCLTWGVYPVKTVKYTNSENMIEKTIGALCDARLLKKGDRVVVTAGIPTWTSGITNFVRVINV